MSDDLKKKTPLLPEDNNGLEISENSPQRETVLEAKEGNLKDIFPCPEVERLTVGEKGEIHQIETKDGCKLYVEEEGPKDGPVLILLHGGPGATQHAFHKSFPQAAKFSRVIYYDQRGCGQSGRSENYSLDQAVGDLEDIRDQLDVNEWVLMGHSYGGLLAQRYALEHPENTSGLVLTCALPGLSTEDLGDRQDDLINGKEKRAIAEINNNPNLDPVTQSYNCKLRGDWKRQSFYKPTEEEMAQMARYEWNHDPKMSSQMSKAAFMEDLEGAFEDCPVPTLLMESENDMTWGKRKTRIFKENHPNAEVVTFESSGHNPFDDEPERYFSELENFMKKLSVDGAVRHTKWKVEHVLQWKNDPNKIITENRKSWKQNEVILDLWDKEGEGLIPQLEERPLNWVAYALYDAQRFEESLTLFETLYSQNPNFEYLVWQGHILDALGQREEAVQKYMQAQEEGGDGEGNIEMSQYEGYRITNIKEYCEDKIKNPWQYKDPDYDA